MTRGMITDTLAELIVKVLKAIFDSGDPLAAAQRALVAAGSEASSEEILKRRLKG